VRRVITNKGGKTSGVDNIILKTPEEYYEAIKNLKKIVDNPESYKSKPVRRIYIPKPGRKEQRPLGIPTIQDRTVQAVYHLAIDPIIESQSDINSFGFRRERSTHDAVNYFRNYMDKQ
jgi:RNA-directed DNA polymerase